MSMRQRKQPGIVRSAGFTLVEIMIALLIGLIGIVVMMQTFAVSEGFKRTATSGTDAQINGGVGLYMLQRELRMAGYGMGGLMVAGCQNVVVWNNTSGTSMNMPLFPFQINPAGVPAGDANTDVLMIVYGTADSAVSGIPLSGSQSSPNDPLQVYNWDAFQTGDLFVTVTPNGANPSCVLHEATATHNPATNCGSTAGIGIVNFGTANYQQYAPSGCVTTTPKFNRSTTITDPSGVAVPIVAFPNATVHNLGNLAIHVYAVRGGILTMCDWVASNCTAVAGFSPAVDGIVSLRAVYQMDISGTVDANAPDGLPPTPSRVALTTNVYYPSRVMAVTMELVARSGLKEKVNQAGVCAITPSATRPDIVQDWIYQSTAGAGIDVSGTSTDWACYRYKL
ncbi:MAG TPA: prepilin-type N-terminal cleavage/methylation domain-containing protein, partial [Usitatibacter sp.]